MPKFTIKDVDKQIEEIRNKHRRPGTNVLQNLLNKAKIKGVPKL